MAGIETIFLVFIDIILHLDTHLQWLIATYEVWIYAILFLIIFCETGLVITPFLPGDSLLFAAGTFAAVGSLKLSFLFPAIFFGALLGDLVNYTLGYHVGPKVFTKEKSLLFNKNYLVRAKTFFEKHGTKAVIIARFLPIIRTFTPFVAGIGKMKFFRFISYSIIGALLWCCIFLLGGYFFGNIPIIRENFTVVILFIIALSLVPILREVYVKQRRKRKIKVEAGK